MTALLSVSDATFGYSRSSTVFEGVSFEVEPGQVYCVMGPNGCGKSTLIDAVLGVHRLRRGSVLVGGDDVSKLKPRRFAERIAYVPQGHTKTFPYSVMDIVLMGRTHASHAFSAPGADERLLALEALADVGLIGFEDRPYTELSGGEVQLVLVARALAQKAGMLVMDEPTAHLDFRHELGVMEIVASLARDRGLSILMATHFLNQAFYLENAGVDTRVALMHDGGFRKEGTPSEVLTSENLSEVFSIATWVANARHEGRERRFILPVERGGRKVGA